MEEGEAQESKFSFWIFFSSPSSYVCTFLYGSNFIRAWRRALDGKDDHVVSSMLLCPSPLRITYPQFFKMVPLKSVELPPAPHFSRIYMKALKVQLLNWSQKTVLSFYDSLVFFNVHWLSFSFSSTTHLSLTACVHCLDISITHARIIRPTVLQACNMGSCEHYNPVWNLNATWDVYNSTEMCYSNLNIERFQSNILKMLTSKGAITFWSDLLRQIFTWLLLYQSP